MKKKWLIIGAFGVLVIIGALVYFSQTSKPGRSPASPSITTPEKSPETEKGLLPTGWQTYTDKTGLFSFSYPSDIDLIHQDEAVVLNKWGPTQKAETEFYDGIGLRFTLVSLGSQTLEQYVQAQVEQEKIISEIIQEVIPASIAGLNGLTFTSVGLGTHQYIYLQNPKGQVLEIVNSTVDPTDQGFVQIANQILETLNFN